MRCSLGKGLVEIYIYFIFITFEHYYTPCCEIKSEVSGSKVNTPMTSGCSPSSRQQPGNSMVITFEHCDTPDSKLRSEVPGANVNTPTGLPRERVVARYTSWKHLYRGHGVDETEERPHCTRLFFTYCSVLFIIYCATFPFLTTFGPCARGFHSQHLTLVALFCYTFSLVTLRSQ